MERSPIGQEEIEKAFSWLNQYWGRPLKPLYYSPKTIEEALSLLENYRGEAKLIAGGIDLIGLMKNKVVFPKVLINLKKIDSLKYIKENENGIDIGPLCLIHDISQSTIIKESLPMLSELSRSIASPQIRNMATIAGNLCQDVRCWYYRRSKSTGISFNCLRKKGNKCFAINGENEYHAIFGEGGCVAVCPSDFATGLTALDGEIQTITPRGERKIPISQFYTVFGHILEPDEIITNIHIPKTDPSAKHRYIKFRQRRAIDFSIVNVYTIISIYEDVIKRARIVIGGVAPIPYRAIYAEKILEGEKLTKNLLEEVADTSVKEAIPLKKNSYKVSIVRALVKRSLI